MELTFFTDYSLRALVFLAVRPDRLCRVSQIARCYGISRNHLVKVIHGLARGGFIETYRGRGGGIKLARTPDKISIGEVVLFTEGRFTPVECFRDDNQCPITPACLLPAILNEAFRSFISTLDRYTLADLLVRRKQLDALLSAARRPPRPHGRAPGRPPASRITAGSR